MSQQKTIGLRVSVDVGYRRHSVAIGLSRGKVLEKLRQVCFLLFDKAASIVRTRRARPFYYANLDFGRKNAELSDAIQSIPRPNRVAFA